ncbi:MAG: hypothetical protein QG656_2544, partial [Candidatus Hydrogenedentes bacterium]|nr:hypothetical protein [Candidatus Hydrogenedentota bacterium]
VSRVKTLGEFAAKAGGALPVTDLLDPRSEGEAGKAHLAALGFHEPDRAREELLRLCTGPRERPFGLHVRHRFAEITPALLDALAEMANPDDTLLRLGRILANLKAPGSLYDILKWNPGLSKHLATLVSNSEYLSEFLARDPGLFDMFGSGRAVTRGVTREELEQSLDELRAAFDSEAAPYRLRDGELLRIGMRELFDNITVLEVGYELTQLAEVVLSYALEQANAKVTHRYGAAEGAFAVLGLGKLGGREMGYGSDLDLVFVYDADAKTESGMAASEYYDAVASHTIRLLKDSTRYGRLYDIDARLRPDGNKGMLTMNDRRLAEYYATEAQAWERLALVKVRAVAGDADFGATVAQRARDIAFELPLTADPMEEVERIRRMIDENVSPLDLKKDVGGIAEIEFTVRLLQLRYAAQYPELKRGDVLGAIDVLAKNTLVDADTFGALTGAYLLFRKIENRIRMMHGRSGSALPESNEAQTDLARRLRIEGNLDEVVREHKEQAHAIYERIAKEIANDRQTDTL